MTHVQELLLRIMKAINADTTISKKALKDQFEKLMFQPLSETKQASSNALRLIIVIDTLDECE